MFLINLPVGALTFAAALTTLPRGASHPEVRLDVMGMTLIGLALAATIYPLIQGRADGWPAWNFVMLVAGVTLLVAFIAYERRRRDAPLIEPGLLANRTYMSGIAVMLAFFATYAGVLLIVSLFCQLGEHFSPIHAGLTLVPMMLGMMAAMFASLPFGDKQGRLRVHLGIALVAAGIIALALTASSTRTLSTWDLAPSLVVIGLGASASFAPLFDIVLAGVAGRDRISRWFAQRRRTTRLRPRRSGPRNRVLHATHDWPPPNQCSCEHRVGHADPTRDHLRARVPAAQTRAGRNRQHR